MSLHNMYNIVNLLVCFMLVIDLLLVMVVMGSLCMELSSHAQCLCVHVCACALYRPVARFLRGGVHFDV